MNLGALCGYLVSFVILQKSDLQVARLSAIHAPAGSRTSDGVARSGRKSAIDNRKSFMVPSLANNRKSRAQAQSPKPFYVSLHAKKRNGSNLPNAPKPQASSLEPHALLCIPPRKKKEQPG